MNPDLEVRMSKCVLRSGILSRLIHSFTLNCFSTLESVVSSNVPSLWMSGCWMFTSIPWSRRLDLQTTQGSVKTCIHMTDRTETEQCTERSHWPGTVRLCVRDEGRRGDERTVQVLANVDLLGRGSTVGMFLSGHYVDGLSFTLDSWGWQTPNLYLSAGHDHKLYSPLQVGFTTSLELQKPCTILSGIVLQMWTHTQSSSPS